VFSIGHVDQDTLSASLKYVQNTFMNSFFEISYGCHIHHYFVFAPNKNNNHTNISYVKTIGHNYVATYLNNESTSSIIPTKIHMNSSSNVILHTFSCIMKGPKYFGVFYTISLSQATTYKSLCIKHPIQNYLSFVNCFQSHIISCFNIFFQNESTSFIETSKYDF